MTTLLAIGVRADPVFVHFLAQARMLGADIDAIDLQEVIAGGAWRLSNPPQESDSIHTPQRSFSLASYTAIYHRFIRPPITGNLDTDSRWSGIYLALSNWLRGSTMAKIINPVLSHQHNSAKPWHEMWLSQHGLSVPDSITASSSDILLRFLEHGPAVIKAVSGIRATTRQITADELGKYVAESGPVHLQRLVQGDDLRVHVVGQKVLSLRFSSNAVDYRKATERRYWQHELPSTVTQLMVRATREQGLLFAGWDFKIDKDDRLWCLESNPMPGYSWYDVRMAGSITAALLEEMAG